MPEAVIVDTVRTPIGRAFKGSLASLRPEEQGAFVVESRRSETTSLTVSAWVEEWSGGDPVRRQLIADEAKLRVRRLILDHADDRGSSVAAAATPVSPAIRHSEVLTDQLCA